MTLPNNGPRLWHEDDCTERPHLGRSEEFLLMHRKVGANGNSTGVPGPVNKGEVL